ncbi:MAG: outer membrane beta-barrel protein, partial [Bacteroidota bacterium]|nr:outer membrane beta-barrel protein [Bacteroidota bacterium]
MRYHYTKRLAKNLLLAILIAGLNLNAFAQDKAPRLSVSAALGIPVTMFGVNSKWMGIYTGAARYSFNKSWSLEAKVTAHTFYNNATGNVKKATLDGTASDVLTYRTPTYGLNGIFYYNLHTIFGLDKKPDARWLPFINFGGGLNWYKPSVSFANGTGGSSSSFGKPYRDYQLGVGTRYYLNHLIDLYAGAEYHYVESYYLDGLREKTNASYDTYLNFYAG